MNHSTYFLGVRTLARGLYFACVNRKFKPVEMVLYTGLQEDTEEWVVRIGVLLIAQLEKPMKFYFQLVELAQRHRGLPLRANVI
jgi:hypothetical protein